MIARPRDTKFEQTKRKVGSDGQSVSAQSLSGHHFGSPSVVESRPNFHAFAGLDGGANAHVSHQLVSQDEG